MRPPAGRSSPRRPRATAATAAARAWPKARAPEPLTLFERRHRQPGALELLPVVLGRLLVAGVDDGAAGGVNHVRDLVPALDGHAGDHARKRARDVVEGVVIVVPDDHLPRAAQAAPRPGGAGQLDGLAHAAKDNGHVATVQLLHER